MVVHLLVDVDHLDRGLRVQVVQLQLLLLSLFGFLESLREFRETLKVLEFQLGVLAEDDLLDQHVRRVLILSRLLLQIMFLVQFLVKSVRDVAHYRRSRGTSADAPHDAPRGQTPVPAASSQVVMVTGGDGGGGGKVVAHHEAANEARIGEVSVVGTQGMRTLLQLLNCLAHVPHEVLVELRQGHSLGGGGSGGGGGGVIWGRRRR